MPRGDKTGPQGLGSKTGRATGYCAGYPVPGYMNPTRGCGRGFGRGFRGRGGRGFGRGRFVYPQPQTPEQEIVALEHYQKSLEVEKADLEQETGSVKARIEELKTTSKQQQK